jgi:hypothetical protein
MNELTFEKVWKDLMAVLGQDPMVYTLVRRKRNKVTAIENEGIQVLTQRSSPGSELVPKWMFERAVDYLIKHGEVNHKILTEKLRVMRSAFVMAALAKLDYIWHEKGRASIFLKL